MIPDDRLRAGIGEDALADLDGHERTVLPAKPRLERARLCRQAAIGDEVANRLADELVVVVAEQPARGSIHLGVAACAVGNHDRVGRQLEREPQLRFGALGTFPSPHRERREVDQDRAIDREQRPLSDGLGRGKPCAHDKLISADRRAEHRRECPRARSCNQAAHQHGGEEQHEWRTGSGDRFEQLSEERHRDNHAEDERITHDGVVRRVRPRSCRRGHGDITSRLCARTKHCMGRAART